MKAKHTPLSSFVLETGTTTWPVAAMLGGSYASLLEAVIRFLLAELSESRPLILKSRIDSRSERHAVSVASGVGGVGVER